VTPPRIHGGCAGGVDPLTNAVDVEHRPSLPIRVRRDLPPAWDKSALSNRPAPCERCANDILRSYPNLISNMCSVCGNRLASLFGRYGVFIIF
jgi:hypothetical protein